uniref:Uncharacterized protein n=1 Tax=Dunaliella tertiolecta TaxID=3047 RepID=A0A7S3QYQ3_DUNTE
MQLAALLHEVTKRRRLAAFSGKQLVGLLVVLTQAQVQLDQRTTGRLLSTLHSCITQGCPSLTAHQLSLAMWALAKTRTSLKAQMMHSLLDRFHEQLPKASIADVASLVWAIPLVSKHYTTWLAVQHSSLLHALADFTLPHLTTCAARGSTSGQQLCGPRQLVQLAVGFTRLRFYPGAEWMRRHRAASIAVQHAFTSTDRAQIRAAYQALLEV